MVNGGIKMMLTEKQDGSRRGKMLTVFEPLLLAREITGGILFLFLALIPVEKCAGYLFSSLNPPFFVLLCSNGSGLCRLHFSFTNWLNVKLCQ